MLKQQELINLVEDPSKLIDASDEVLEQVTCYFTDILQSHIKSVSFKLYKDTSGSSGNQEGMNLSRQAFALQAKDVIKKGINTYLRNRRWTNTKLTYYLIRTISNLGKMETQDINGREFHKKKLICPACKSIFGSSDFLDVYDKECFCKNCEENIAAIEKELSELRQMGK